MLSEFWEVLKIGYRQYFATALYPLLYTVGAAFVCMYGSRHKKEKLVYIPVFMLVFTVCNPLYWKVIDSVFDYAYYRAYWNIPIFFILTCMAVYAIKIKNKKVMVEAAAVLIVVLCVWGTVFNQQTEYLKWNAAQNIYKLPDEVIDVAQILEQDGAEGRPVLAPKEINMYIRGYNGKINVCINNWLGSPYEKKDIYIWDYINIMNAQINSEVIDFNRLMTAYSGYGWDYTVVRKTQLGEQQAEDYGFTKIGETENYAIYR